MTNCFTILDSKFEIRRENVIPAFLALQEYTTNSKNWTRTDGSGFYCIEAASIELAMNATNINQLMEVWYWKVIFSTLNGDIVEINPLTEYWGEDKLMFGAIAPYVKTGSFIHIKDDYGETKYLFTKGKLVIQKPKWD